jgi:hypothetical protein
MYSSDYELVLTEALVGVEVLQQHIALYLAAGRLMIEGLQEIALENVRRTALYL